MDLFFQNEEQQTVSPAPDLSKVLSFKYLSDLGQVIWFISVQLNQWEGEAPVGVAYHFFPHKRQAKHLLHIEG